MLLPGPGSVNKSRIEHRLISGTAFGKVINVLLVIIF